ncbi:MAG: prepilin-type N-terminal cleavage/methylation domain-containing protein [bacterium]|nr:prepilin-type N-terminal cleavage/methylation domain-containing protein [bacterium]
MMKYFWKKRGQRGFTLIELVVVLAILGILIALAVPRYLGARRGALIAEGDNVLQEIKTLAWAYYQQYGTFAGGGDATVLGFVAPPDDKGCWAYSFPSSTGALISMRATGDSTPAKCGPVNLATITLILNSDGSSARSQTLP